MGGGALCPADASALNITSKYFIAHCIYCRLDIQLSSQVFHSHLLWCLLIYFHVPWFSQNVKIYSLHANFEKRVLEVLKYNKNCTNGDSTGVPRVVRLISAVFPMLDDHVTKTQEVIGQSNWESLIGFDRLLRLLYHVHTCDFAD